MYTSDQMFLFSFLGAYVGVLCILAVAAAVLTIVANWKIYTKAGKAGWKCLIPIYNIYVLFDIAWEVRQFWIYIALFAAYDMFMLLGTCIGAFFTVLAVIALVAMIVWSIRLLNHLSASFGHGPWFTVGLILLNTIFVLILGFEKSEYHKVQASTWKESDDEDESSEDDQDPELDDEEDVSEI